MVGLQAFVESAFMSAKFLGTPGDRISELQEEKKLGKFSLSHDFPSFHG
jgi:hypothetical protein